MTYVEKMVEKMKQEPCAEVIKQIIVDTVDRVIDIMNELADDVPQHIPGTHKYEKGALEKDGHWVDCIGYSEGQACCLGLEQVHRRIREVVLEVGR